MRKNIIIAVLLAFTFCGCTRYDESETELLRKATARLSELEDTLVSERETYSNNHSQLMQELSLKRAQYSAEIAKLNAEIVSIQKDVDELGKDAKEMKAYIVILQHRLETMREMKMDKM